MADKNNAALSLCVDKVLDCVGASEQIRRNLVEKGFIAEIMSNLFFPILDLDIHTRHHYFGSWCEGTTTKGLASDIDRVFYDINYPAVEQIPDVFVDGYLIINDGTTKPGYVKLQTIQDRIPLTSNVAVPNFTDQFGRVCDNNRTNVRLNTTPAMGLREERKGPAITSSTGIADLPDLDRVYAYRCYSIPTFANGWIHKLRKYDWPSKEQLYNMSMYGCFLVGKGHPSSQTEHLEWRISFSFQERELMHSLNSTQHKCYILLKIIKQDLISKMDLESIISYHLKTALFYTIENNPAHIWLPDHLVYCTELCLKQLLDWLNNKYCPNFFVPEENMFDRLSSGVLEMTAKFVRDMLDSDGKYLMSLTCDKFGELLKECLFGNAGPTLSRDAILFDVNNKMYLMHASLIPTNKVIIGADRNCASETLSALKLFLEQLRKSEDRLASEKVFREIKQGINLILPDIHLQIAKTIATIMLTVTDTDKKHELMQDFNHHIELSTAFGSMSQGLVKASFMFKENKLEECERILADCENSLQDFILHTCPCFGYYLGHDYERLIEKENITGVSPLEFRRMYVTPCLIFLPSQADLVPTPLQYEMYRSVGTHTDTVGRDTCYWFGTIAIDTRMYLFFLQYLVYSKLNKHELAVRAAVKLFNILCECESTITRFPIEHLETGYNFYGWICKDKHVELAKLCFYRSWKIRPHHNAAKWHTLILMYEHFISVHFHLFKRQIDI